MAPTLAGIQNVLIFGFGSQIKLKELLTSVVPARIILIIQIIIIIIIIIPFSSKTFYDNNENSIDNNDNI